MMTTRAIIGVRRAAVAVAARRGTAVRCFAGKTPQGYPEGSDGKIPHDLEQQAGACLQELIDAEEGYVGQLVWFNLAKGKLHYVPDIDLYFRLYPVKNIDHPDYNNPNVPAV